MADGATIVGSKAALPAFKEGEGAGIKKLDIVSNEKSDRNVMNPCVFSEINFSISMWNCIMSYSTNFL